MSPLYSSRMYSHSKTCLSTSWKAIFAASRLACAVKYFLSVFDTLFFVKSSRCFLAVVSSRSFRLRLSKFAFRLLLLIKCRRIGFMILKSMSLLIFEIALCGASAREIWFVASLNLQLSEMIKGSSTWASPEVTDSLKPSNRSLKLSTPFMNTSTFSKISFMVTSKTQKSLTIPSKTGSSVSPMNHFCFSTFHSVRIVANDSSTCPTAESTIALFLKLLQD
mmetsp:Transcript_18526/g.33557  ORF Transcript_18526/g.33557 Transcript_18526/m.33557 type:complete len:221 (+) Transcript_18526:255-917(+)